MNFHQVVHVTLCQPPDQGSGVFNLWSQGHRLKIRRLQWPCTLAKNIPGTSPQQPKQTSNTRGLVQPPFNNFGTLGIQILSFVITFVFQYGSFSVKYV